MIRGFGEISKGYWLQSWIGVLRALSELGATFRSADVVVLCYHRVRSRERFADQMAVLSERGYSVLTLPQFTEWLNGSARLARRAALLTFDHCYAEQLEHPFRCSTR